MALFVDSAVASEVDAALSLGVVVGVTTNPTLVRRTGQTEDDALKHLALLQPGRIFVQLAGRSADGLVRHLEHVRSLLPDTPLVFKITPTWPAMEVCAAWKNEEDFLVTAVNTVEQAYVAKEAGAKYIAVYLHRYRLRNGSWPPIAEIHQMTNGSLRVMVASLHDMAEVRWALVSGSDDLTLPLSTIQTLLVNRDSEDDIARFDRDVPNARH